MPWSKRLNILSLQMMKDQNMMILLSQMRVKTKIPITI